MEALPIEDKILQDLEKSDINDSEEYAQKIVQTNHQEVVGAIKSLERDNFVIVKQYKREYYVITDEGKEYINLGTPEYRIYQAIPDQGIALNECEKLFNKNIFDIGSKNGMKKKWYGVDKQTKLLKRQAQNVVDEDKEQLLKLLAEKGRVDALDKNILKNLCSTRKLIEKKEDAYFSIGKGPNYTSKRVKKESDLTAKMLEEYRKYKKEQAELPEGQEKKPFEWKELKPYNWQIGSKISTGNLHPLMKVKTEFKEVLLEMGFEEMPTNKYIESSFWNFDALFVPQQHPARDCQDTFFMSDPELAAEPNKTNYLDYWERVKDIHQTGSKISFGYNYKWCTDESRRNVLRTHTTAVSSRMLYRLAQETKEQGKFTPKKYFSIDRVFRNENLDQTHLAEFHQIEGIVADYNVGLGHLMGFIERFFLKIGIKEVSFKPTFNPYTEPSLEVYGYHPVLKKQVEIGNSGVFRPEMLIPMGLPPDVQVLGLGLGLERPTMIQYGINNIRDLLGDEVDLKSVVNNPICYLK